MTAARRDRVPGGAVGAGPDGAGGRPQQPPTGLRLEPFRATVYDDRSSAHLQAVTSPAYDLIPPAQRSDLSAADPHNVVRLILPLDQPGTADKYDCAGRTLARWIADGVLRPSVSRALFVYEMTSPPSDLPLPGAGTGSTIGVVGQVPVLPPGDPGVFPHEDVWPPVVDDRRRLAEATRANLEPIVLAADLHAGDWPDVLAVRRTPAVLDFVSDDGVRHRIWALDDPAAQERVAAAVNGRSAVIADGHHRWASYQAVADVPGSDRALAYLVPVDGAGLEVRAIHRLVEDWTVDGVAVAAAGVYAEVGEVELAPTRTSGPVDRTAAASAALALLAGAEPGTVLVTDGERWLRLATPDPGDVGEAFDRPSRAERSDRPGAAWRSLDVTVAHRLLLEGRLGIVDDDPRLHPVHDLARALAGHRPGDGVLVVLRSATPAQVLAVARAGDRMPRKSTLFVPKPRNGLLMRRFEDNETPAGDDPDARTGAVPPG